LLVAQPLFDRGHVRPQEANRAIVAGSASRCSSDARGIALTDHGADLTDVRSALSPGGLDEIWIAFRSAPTLPLLEAAE
jgi:hypothetical protein